MERFLLLTLNSPNTTDALLALPWATVLKVFSAFAEVKMLCSSATAEGV